MLVDAHCHISTDFDESSMDELTHCYSQLEGARFVVMSTNHIDYRYVDTLARNVDSVIPSFGVHPWYSHLFTLETDSASPVDKQAHYAKVFKKDVDEEFLSVLPEPINLDKHINGLVSLCKEHKVVCWGEIGLDKLFRIPSNGFFANPEFKNQSDSTKLTNYRTSMEHQKEVFTRQLRIAFELNFPVSIHNVKTSGVIHDLIKSELLSIPDTRSLVCLHSYTGSVDTLKLFISTFKKQRYSKFYASFSSVLNNCGPKKDQLQLLIDVLPKDSVLSETDMTLDSFIERAGPLELLRDIVGALGGDEQLLLRNGCSFLGIESFV